MFPSVVSLCFVCLEVIDAAERNAGDLGPILQGLKKEEVEEKTFDQGLNVCATYGYLDAASKFIIKGADNFAHCVETAVRFHHYNIAALLLLCDAASHDDVACIRCLFNENIPPPRPEAEHEASNSAASNSALRGGQWFPRIPAILRRQGSSAAGKSRPRTRQSSALLEPHLSQVRRILRDGSLKTVHVINVALRKEQARATLELLLNTDCNRENGNVDWHGLALRQVERTWLKAVEWAQRLLLASNGLTKVK